MDRHRGALPRLIGGRYRAAARDVFFGELPPGEALGCRLAHAVDAASGRLRKGTLLDADAIASLVAAGHERVVVARVDPDEEHEDVAAARVAAALGTTLRRSGARTGRVNLFAPAEGLLVIERELVLAANRVDEGITAATLAENVRVVAGRLVATVKIIPFAVPTRHVDTVVELLHAARRDGREPLALAALVPRTAALVHTTLPTLKAGVVEKTSRITRERLAARAMTLVHEARCAHDAHALARAIDAAARAAPDVLLVVGASAISDRRDVIPSAVARAGGRVARFGVPVDPGNLLLVARLGATTVLGLPGCARSPRDNGLDRVLDRIACGVPLADDWLESLAVGGLLDEVVERPSPRVAAAADPAADTAETGRDAASTVAAGAVAGTVRNVPADTVTTPDDAATAGSDTSERAGAEAPRAAGGAAPARVGVERVAALVLAAGASRRAGALNKLLYPVAGEPMVRRVVRQLVASAVDDVLVVTGHEADAVGAALDGLDARLVHNPAHASGMAGSLVRGLSALLDRDAVLVCLADMPDVSAALVGRLLAARRALPASDRPRTILVPVADGRRGNPVLFGRLFFDLLLGLDGDVGARALVRAHPDAVHEVDVGDRAVLSDHDTVAALRRLDGR